MDLLNNIGTALGVISGGLLAALALLYQSYKRLKLYNQMGETESSTLLLLNAAVQHWRGLYDVAWEQVGKEREHREAAEKRAIAVIAEVEELRAHVASLEREITRLTALVKLHYPDVDNPTPTNRRQGDEP